MRQRSPLPPSILIASGRQRAAAKRELLLGAGRCRLLLLLALQLLHGVYQRVDNGPDLWAWNEQRARRSLLIVRTQRQAVNANDAVCNSDVANRIDEDLRHEMSIVKGERVSCRSGALSQSNLIRSLGGPRNSSSDLIFGVCASCCRNFIN